MNKLYGLFYTEAVKNPNMGAVFIPSLSYPERMIAAAHSIDKLTSIIPHVKKWHLTKRDDGSTLQYAETADNSKYKIHEIPYVC